MGDDIDYEKIPDIFVAVLMAAVFAIGIVPVVVVVWNAL